MTVYLRDFRFRSIVEEEKMIDAETRTCFNSHWPLGIFPATGLWRMEFESVTILHGGNGSGKSTALNVIAARLGVLRELPFTSPFFERYVNGGAGAGGPLEYNSELPWELRPVPEGSRFLASEDVFDRTLAVRGRNLEIGRERTAAGNDWLNANYEKPMQLSTIHGEEFERFKRQNALRRKSMSQVIREEVGFDVKTGPGSGIREDQGHEP